MEQEPKFEELLDFCWNQMFAGGNFFSMDHLFVHSLITGAKATNHGFETMMEQKNYFCAIPMIRQQVDGALVMWASFLAKDQNKFFLHFLKGKPINQIESDWDHLAYFGLNMDDLIKKEIVSLVDKNGKKNKNPLLLTNRFLYETLDVHFAGIKSLYKKCCKYVHPSEELFRASLFTMQQGRFKIKTWKESAPLDYSEEDMRNDMQLANSTLADLLATLGKLLAQTAQSGNLVMDEEDAKYAEEFIRILINE